MIQQILLWFFFSSAFQSLCALSLAEQFKHVGYAEIEGQKHAPEMFDTLYTCFDTFIEFLQTHPTWAQKLYTAKERFIRSPERHYYATDFFGFYDESRRAGRNQISFYYSTHFHEYICSHYQAFKSVPEIICFFEMCREMQNPYGALFTAAADELEVGPSFSSHLFSNLGQPPMLLKIIKYLPSYSATRPHYDGTAFSLFIDSTDNQSLLLAAYRPSFTVDDFSTPSRKFQNSIVLIPGTLLTEFSISPTPHIVRQSGKTRYATIAFAMRPHYSPQKHQLSPLPNLKD